MKVAFRPLLPGENDPELLALGTSASMGASALAWLATGLPLPRCAFHALTGFPCPTCGATRCVLALIHGHVSQALGWNPLIFTGLAGMALVNLYATAVLLGGLPRIRFSCTGREGRVLKWACLLLVAANWAYEIHRGV